MYRVFLLLLLVCACATASQEPPPYNHNYGVALVIDGLEHPWGMALLPDGGMLVTERPGRLRRVQNNRLLAPIEGLPRIAAGGQGGLLDVAIHPDFATNRLIYLSYSKPVSDGKTTALWRARLGDNRLDDGRDIFIAQPAHRTSHHFGSRIAFGGDGKLYLSIGDRGESELAQSLSNHMGKVVRLNLDGATPTDNPFVDTPGALAEIYSYGHRNPQGMTRRAGGAIWIHEHGPKGGDEINPIQAGVNYGWPVITYGRAYSGLPIGEGTSKPGLRQPLWYWTPSIAPSGLIVYSGEAFPELQGDLLVGSLKFRYLERLRLRDGKVYAREKLIADAIGRVRDIALAPGGEVYLLNDETDGGLFRLVRN